MNPGSIDDGSIATATVAVRGPRDDHVTAARADAITAAIETLRARQPLRVDPLRWLRIEALARRAEGQHERIRGLLEARLAALIDAHRAALDRHESMPRGQDPRHGHGHGHGRPLRALIEAWAEPHTESPADDGGPHNPHELRALHRHRDTWRRLSAEQQLRHSLDQVPPQAGPLNSPHLVHRALQSMQASAPGYLQHFVAHVDALLWLERLVAEPHPSEPRSDPAPSDGRPAPRAAQGASTRRRAVTGAGSARVASTKRVR